MQHAKEQADCYQKKAARRRPLNSNLMIVDHTAINAGFAFRRHGRPQLGRCPGRLISREDGPASVQIKAAPSKRRCRHNDRQPARRKTDQTKRPPEGGLCFCDPFECLGGSINRQTKHCYGAARIHCQAR
jgi:hypothetical protein